LHENTTKVRKNAGDHKFEAQSDA